MAATLRSPLTIRLHSIVHLLLLVQVHHASQVVRYVLAASRESRLELPNEDQILVLEGESEATHQVGVHLAPKLQVAAHPLFQFHPAWGNAVEAKY